MKSCASFILICALSAGHCVNADVVYLKDGSQLEGSVRRSDDGWVVRTKTRAVNVAADEVESIELSPATAPSGAMAMERLASLRRSVENLTDLPDIISRFQRFVDQSNDPVTAQEAKKDLAFWQNRLNQKQVKFGNEWVLPAELDKRAAQAQDSADTGRQLMKQGRTKEAEPILQSVLLLDPQNPTALYLMGVLRYQQDEIPAARKAFEAVSVQVPDHAPTLNNLALMLWRQKQYVQAIASLDGAMLASPANKIILDNATLALQSLPMESQHNPIVEKAIRHFQEQDQQLAEQMARAGLHRFGSVWASEKDIAEFKSQEKQIQNQLDLVSGHFDRMRDRVDQLNQNISDNQVLVHRIEATSYIADPRSGAVISVAYPPAYYDLQRDNQRMIRDRDHDLTSLDQLKKQARDLEDSKPSRNNQSVFRSFGVEGTPIKLRAILQLPKK